MRICLVGSSKKFFSGLSAYTITLANAFAERGHKVSVILLRNLVPLFLYPGRERVGKGEYSLNFKPGIEIYEGMDWNSPTTWNGALQFMKDKNSDAFIVQWWTSSVAHMQFILALAARRTAKRPISILEMHEVVDPLEEKILPIRLYSRIAGRMVIRQFDTFVAHSEEARKAIIETYNISRDKVFVIPHGLYDNYTVENRDLARKELGVNGFVILYFGMIRQYKGVPILIKAFNMLPGEIAKNSHLIIAGEDWGDDPLLRPSINDSPFKERITFLPEFIPDSMVPKYFSAADVVVLPYLRSCGSGVVNLTVAQGKPVIATELDTMKEYLGGYQGASFFPAGDYIALRDKLMITYKQWQSKGTIHYPATDNDWGSIIQKFEQIISLKNSIQ